jgi:large subunit ribosomal protein L29
MAKGMKYKEMTLSELKNKLTDLKVEHRNLRFNRTVGQVSNTNRFRAVRRDIARIMTILREYELGIRKPRDAQETPKAKDK